MFEKIPPQAIQFEEAILGALLVESSKSEKVSSILPEYFYKESHKLIFEAIQSLYRSSEPIDIITVPDKLMKLGTFDQVGGYMYVNELANKVNSGAHFDYHLAIVIQKYLQREAIRYSSEIIELSFSEDDILEEVETKLMEIQNLLINSTLGEITGSGIQEIMSQSKEIAIKKMTDRKEGKEIGISIPIGVLHQILGGWQQGDLVYLAGRPSMGKTAVAIKFAKHAAKKGAKTVFFSLEMNNIPIVDRAALGEVDIDPEDWKNGNITQEDLDKYDRVRDIFKEWHFKIYDKSSIRPEHIRAICKKDKPDIIFIDYIGLMKPNAGERFQNRNLEMGSISHELKAIVKDFNIPVICLSQLSRASDSVPSLTHLRDSGELEQDADVVIFPHRPYYYSKQEEDKGIIEFHVAKHRNGRTGMVEGSHNKYMNDFFDKRDEELPIMNNDDLQTNLEPF
jgi:replicative DNA helicase